MSRNSPNSNNSRLEKYKQLEEIGLANLPQLLDRLGVQWRYVPGSTKEIDILATWRGDNHFGSCRFNSETGVGADFADQPFSQDDLNKLGVGFDFNDIYHKPGRNNTSYFHLLGLMQRIHDCGYRRAAAILAETLMELGGNLVASAEALEQRQLSAQQKRQRAQQQAQQIWTARAFNYEGTLGETYLSRRGIKLPNVERDIKFVPQLYCAETTSYVPALLFAIRETPKSPILGAHRIYLDEDGNKAQLNDPKRALGSVKGNGIWFGQPDRTLCIAEGPETALSLITMGYKFVCCAVWASNLGNINLGRLMEEVGDLQNVIVCADNDDAGKRHAMNAAEHYNELAGVGVRIMFPSDDCKDFNEMLLSGPKDTLTRKE